MATAGNEIWELWLAASKTSYVVDQCIATTEPAYLAKHVFQLAQLFNTFYHRHPILSEADEKRKQFLAGDRRRGPARTDSRTRRHGHHRSASHVEFCYWRRRGSHRPEPGKLLRKVVLSHSQY